MIRPLLLFFMATAMAFAGSEALRAEGHKPLPFTNDLGMKFVYLPPGTFLMGSPLDELYRNPDEELHPVTLSRGFFMQTTEVTQRQWRSVMGYNPSKYKECGSDCPVEMVTWNAVQAFIRRLNARSRDIQYRLPTEAEWEYACRAGTRTPFFYGDYLSSDQANYNGHFPLPGTPRGINRNSTMPVGSFPPNAFGLYDLHGNVVEWCQDYYGAYPPGAVTDPVGPARGMSRVCRGGGMSSYARRCRSANRTRHLPDYWNFYIGFRLVCSVTPKGTK
ncbi:MAG: formylglycine-generating enzyme family protein [Thermodesulfobacteriota bacterium]